MKHTFTVKLPGDLPDKSGCVYPPDVLKKAVDDAQDKVKARRLIGEIDPPGDGRSRISRASHVVTDLRIEKDGSVKADLEFLDTEAGRLARHAVMTGMPLSVGMRATGTVVGNVVENMNLLGVDFDFDAVGCYPPSVVDQLAWLADKEDDEDLETNTGE